MTKSRLPRNNRRKNSGLILVVVGLVLLLVSGYIRFHSRAVLSFTGTVAPSNSGYNRVNITNIQIESVKIDLKVTEASITDGIWQISSDGASHLDKSANPGGGGNIVVYGHNKANLFGKLTRVRKGDIVKLKDESGATHEYAVVETVTVAPTQIEYVIPKDSEILTLYTCTGVFDSKRFIVQAKPI